MANWLKVKVNMEKVSDAEAREDLRERLGIDIEIDESEDVWRDIVIDLDRVTTYAPFYDGDAEPVKDRCSISLDTGEFINLFLDFNKLDKLLRLREIKDDKVEKKED